jgi:hypothetical protein
VVADRANLQPLTGGARRWHAECTATAHASYLFDASNDLSAGEAPLSEGLRDLFRLRRALLEHFPADREELTPTAHDASLVFLAQVEAERGITLPYDVIALAVLRVPIFVRAVGLAVAQLGDVIRDCAGDFHPPRGWVAITSYGTDAMRRDVPFAQRGHDTLLAVRTDATDRTAEPSVRVLDGPGASTLVNLSTLIRERLAKRYATSERWTAALERARSIALDDGAESVRIVDDRPPQAALVRVTHVKFGEGTVVRELEGDKIEIAFDKSGTKTLQRRFIQVLPKR